MRSDTAARQAAMAEHDRVYWDSCTRVAGMDEAGRGPLAGNVVAACVIMPPEPIIPWVDDSKKLSPKRRECVFEQIHEINILQATMNAMRRAAQGAEANIYLIDAVKNLGLDAPEVPIIHGDAVSYSIAAASIVAKVTRDRELEELDQLYPQYGFAQHKGYGTAAHIAAIRQYGPCPEHRRSFIGKFI